MAVGRWRPPFYHNALPPCQAHEETIYSAPDYAGHGGPASSARTPNHRMLSGFNNRASAVELVRWRSRARLQIECANVDPAVHG